MSGTVGFWLAAGGLTAVAIALVLRPLLASGPAGSDPSWVALARTLARDQLGVLAAQRARGELDETAHAAALAELARGLDDPASTGAAAPASPASRAGVRTAWIVGALVPLAAVATYLALGAPGALEQAVARRAAPAVLADDSRIPHSVLAMVEQLETVLDDSLAMRPELRLSAFDAVVVGARISRSGSATPAPGDIASEVVPARRGAQDPVTLVLDRRVP